MNNLYKYIKFFITKIKSPKYQKTGSCIQCGKCCREITFNIQGRLISTEKEFESLKKWQPYYNNFKINAEAEDGTKLFTCKHISNNNKCKKYKVRSIYCRQYPFSPETLKGCGYSFKPNKSFQNILNKKKLFYT